jgi:hypothetical protein
MIQVLRTAEIETWLIEQLALTPIPTFREIRAARQHPSANFEKQTPGRMLALATTSIRWLMDDGARPALLVVHEHGIWGSSELRSLFGLLRGDSCTIADLDASPGHAFEPRQPDRLSEALWLTMCFGWGVRVHAAQTARVIQTDHDGNLWLLGSPGTMPTEL